MGEIGGAQNSFMTLVKLIHDLYGEESENEIHIHTLTFQFQMLQLSQLHQQAEQYLAT